MTYVNPSCATELMGNYTRGRQIILLWLLSM